MKHIYPYPKPSARDLFDLISKEIQAYEEGNVEA